MLENSMIVEAWNRHGKNIRATARFLNISRHRVSQAVNQKMVEAEAHYEGIDPEDVLSYLEGRYKSREKERERTSLVKFNVPLDGPLLLVNMGDPHLGDKGCNVPLLRRDAGIMASVENCLCVMIGDVTNHWDGRKAHLYADQSTSREDEYMLARWLCMESGIPWLFWILGNHDMFRDGAFMYRTMTKERKIPCYKWEARFDLVFPNGREIRAHAAHDFPGFSMWNEGHGFARAARMTSDAELFLSGHRHHWFQQHFELPGQRRVISGNRARGYKWDDEWSKMNGYKDGHVGASVAIIIDPDAESLDEAITTFPSLSLAAKFHEFLREKHHAKAKDNRRVRGAGRRGEVDGSKSGGKTARRSGKTTRRTAKADAPGNRSSARKPVRDARAKGKAAA